MSAKPILVVDDDRDIREAVTSVLHDAGYPVLCAANGEAALHILRSSPEPVALILLDLMMPVMDGWEFRRRQQDEPSLRGIPVVILSAGGQIEKKAQNLEAAGWLRKPVRIDALLDEVSGALSRGADAARVKAER